MPVLVLGGVVVCVGTSDCDGKQGPFYAENFFLTLSPLPWLLAFLVALVARALPAVALGNDL